MNILKYKDFEGTAEIDADRQVCRGKVLFITDLVTYEADTPSGLQKEFEAAIDDYLETCKSLGRQPQKPFRGQFNVRVTPELHRASAVFACTAGVSLNEVVSRALDAYVNSSKVVTNNVQIMMSPPGGVTSATVPPETQAETWKTIHVH